MGTRRSSPVGDALRFPRCTSHIPPLSRLRSAGGSSRRPTGLSRARKAKRAEEIFSPSQLGHSSRFWNRRFVLSPCRPKSGLNRWRALICAERAAVKSNRFASEYVGLSPQPDWKRLPAALQAPFSLVWLGGGGARLFHHDVEKPQYASPPSVPLIAAPAATKSLPCRAIQCSTC